MKRFFVAVVVGAFILTGCGSLPKDNAEVVQEMRRVEAGELVSADISLASDSISHTVLYNSYEGLYRFGEGNELMPAGAVKRAEISEDGLVYTLRLNDKATWSDGKPVTADDYVFSWRRTVNPKTASEYSAMFSPVKNAKKIMSEELDVDELGITAKSDYDLVIELETATPYFESLLALPNFFPQREDIVEKYGDDYTKTADKAVYNGAFRLSNYDLSSGGATEWTFVKNDHYWDKKNVHMDKIENIAVKDAGTAFAMYEKGEVDETYLFGEYVAQNINSEEAITIVKPSTYYIQYNMENEILSRDTVRAALASATNREAIAEKILANGSQAIESYVPRNVYYNAATHEDFVDTVELEDDSGAIKTWDTLNLGRSLELELLIPDDDGIKKIAEYLQEEYQKQLDGLTVKVTPVPAQVYMERVTSGDFDMIIFGWKADYPDATTFLNNLSTDNPFNFGKYTNETYDKLLSQVNDDGVMSEEARWDKLLQANNIMLNDQPLTPIFQQVVVTIRNTSFLNIYSRSFGTNFDFKETMRVS
ncbi:peptide ABC transporter substrate-binding protein [Enterococcus sp. 5H]|uniref:peptide ABC transporter substrate-binding protein n=1 Tax=Enterococcus sp. 5H TaxID=1229490 RepID=UPI0023039580|nr:peptide ABC transporter substrate-binding protein [Enterococcus sp. 5H]MDA9472039.1 Oligopeptide ABC transporter, periplasmic oligopeptide-binding protein OppA [Enterococcus sp. 5H]